MGIYRLTPATQQDLEGIWTYIEGNRGIEGALDYIDSIEAACHKLSAMPKMCRERTEHTPPVRIYPHRQHLIVYISNGNDIDVIRVLHARMDVDDQLSAS